MSYGTDFRFTLFTNDPLQAAWADKSGITRAGPDLEIMDKHLRQDANKTWISDHQIEEIPDVYRRLSPEKRFVRCNPIHRHSGAELERLIELGAKTIMLPYFISFDQVETFISLLDGRATPLLLVETAASAEFLDRLVTLTEVQEIHLGLNDLHLTLGMKNHFELLCSPLMEELCMLLKQSGKQFGFGGVGRAMDDSLLIPSDLVYAQYPRLGATGALVSRVFTKDLPPEKLPQEIERARQRLTYWSVQPSEKLHDMHEQLSRLAINL